MYLPNIINGSTQSAKILCPCGLLDASDGNCEFVVKNIQDPGSCSLMIIYISIIPQSALEDISCYTVDTA